MEKRKKLLELYLEDGFIEYEFNLDEEETIISNNLLLHGVLGKIQKSLLEVDPVESEKNPEDNEGEGDNDEHLRDSNE